MPLGTDYSNKSRRDAVNVDRRAPIVLSIVLVGAVLAAVLVIVGHVVMSGIHTVETQMEQAKQHAGMSFCDSRRG